MFTNLRRNNKENKYKNRTYQQAFIEKRTLAHQKGKDQSYIYMHKKKKQNKIGLYSHQLIQSKMFLYEGICNLQTKNGQGIMFTKNGTMIIGRWLDDVLNGKTLICTPFGGVISAQFLDGKLNGWVISLYQDKIVCMTYYFQNLIDSQRIMFETHQELWVASKYTADGKFQKITHVQKGDINNLPGFIDNEQLEAMYKNFVIQKKMVAHLKTIKQMKICCNTTYVGYTDEKGVPSGLGCLFSTDEMFIGNFHEGCLHNFGRIIFRNGQIYQGFLYEGQFINEGIYYSPIKNQTSLIKTDQVGKTQINQQFEGYLLVDFQPKLGISSLNSSIGINIGGMNYQTQLIEKYYSQWNIQNKIKNDYEMSNRENPSQQEFFLNQTSGVLIRRNISPQKSPQKMFSLPKDNKWIQDDKSGHSSEIDSPRRAQSITKLQVLKRKQARKKQEQQIQKGKQIKKMITFKSQNDDRFASIPIQQNQNNEQMQSFSKNLPKETHKKMLFKKNQSPSLKIQNINSLNNQQISNYSPKLLTPQNLGTSQGPWKKFKEYIEAEDSSFNHSSSKSNISNKMNDIVRKTYFKRKKIFQ